MHKLVGVSALPTALTLMTDTVFAASKDKQDSTLKTDELSLYTSPHQSDVCEETAVSELEQSVSVLRAAMKPYFSWCQHFGGTVVGQTQGIYDTAKPTLESSVQFGKDTLHLLSDPPAGFYPRAGVIGFAGILGLFLSRGSRAKKVIYPSALVTLVTSMYYPQQVAQVAKTTGDGLYEWSLQGYVAMETLWKGKKTHKDMKTTDKENPK